MLSDVADRNERVSDVFYRPLLKQPNTLPSYRNCNSHQIATSISHVRHVGICLQGADTLANEGFTI